MELYACYNKNEKVRLESSSGGVFSLIASDVISQGGVVYAVIYNERHEAEYARISKIEDLQKSYGSKYVQAKLNNTFRNIRNDIENCVLVLFVGTPCCCSGLLKFLGDDRKHLICVDFACHGVPSVKIWRRYVDTILGKGMEIDSINMRSKMYGWKDYGMRITFKDGTNIQESKKENAYLRGFLRDLYLRPSCYDCTIKGLDRITDITIGDYWGIKEADFENGWENGVSFIIIHTSLGKRVFERISKFLLISVISEDDVNRKNSGLVRSATLKKDREIFYRKFFRGDDLKHIIYDLTGKTFMSKIKKKIHFLIYKE